MVNLVCSEVENLVIDEDQEEEFQIVDTDERIPVIVMTPTIDEHVSVVEVSPEGLVKLKRWTHDKEIQVLSIKEVATGDFNLKITSSSSIDKVQASKSTKRKSEPKSEVASSSGLKIEQAESFEDDEMKSPPLVGPEHKRFKTSYKESKASTLSQLKLTPAERDRRSKLKEKEADSKERLEDFVAQALTTEERKTESTHAEATGQLSESVKRKEQSQSKKEKDIDPKVEESSEGAAGGDTGLQQHESEASSRAVQRSEVQTEKYDVGRNFSYSRSLFAAGSDSSTSSSDASTSTTSLERRAPILLEK